ncbi:MAG TPA: T9SS type A sorting domain-containing protein, partial [Bacteroidota bacterium]|nr:T9SS type A sorting domain-containing protein [Bacteroidota bacterium]
SRLDSNNIFTFDQIFQKTTDGGLTWNQFNGPNYIHKKVGTYFQTFENGILYSIEIGRYIYLDSTAGCVRGAVYPDSADWVYKSTDYGETWTSYKGINIVFEENLRYFFLTENIWFTYGGSYISTLPDTNSSIIRKTTDAGRTWHYVLDTIYIDLWGSSQIRDISFSDSLNGIATAYTTIWKTSDGGETWQTDTSFHPTSSSQLIEHILMIDKHTAIGIPDVWGYVYRWTEDYEVSVNEHNERNSAAIIFPNPARDYIYINSAFIEGAGGVWQYQIYDILGNCVQSGTTESKTININQLSAGFYTVRFFNAGKQVVEKMIKE